MSRPRTKWREQEPPRQLYKRRRAFHVRKQTSYRYGIRSQFADKSEHYTEIKMDADEVIRELERQKRGNSLELTSKVLEGVAPLVTALMMFKRNRITDWIGLGLALINTLIVGRKVYQDVSKADDILWRTGSDGRSLFVEMPAMLRPIALNVFRHHESFLVDSEGIHDVDEPVHVVKLRGEVFVYQNSEVRHTTKQNFFNLPAVYLLRSRHEESMQILREECWRDFDSNHLQLSEEGIQAESEILESEDLFVTDKMRNTLKMMMEFVEAGKMRSYLLEGPPGTGKTTLIRYLIKATGFRTLRIDISQFQRRAANAVTPGLRTLIEFSKPDMVIIDDIDSLSPRASKELLSTIEWCRSHVKVFLASANNRRRMTPALYRVGRFDETIEVNALDIEVIRKILGPDLESEAERFKEWPIAYLTDLRTKVEVMGKERALDPEVLEKTSERIQEINQRIREDFKQSNHSHAEIIVDDDDY